MALRRSLGVTALTFYAVGMTLGAGVYSVIGAAAGLAGAGLWLSFALGAGVALLTGLSYAELAAMHPSAGAEFAYLRAALPRAPWLATTVGVLLVVSGIATAATVTLAFAGYLRGFVELPALPVALALIAAFTALNVVGIKESAGVNIAFTAIEAAGLILVIAVAVARADLLAPLAAGVDASLLPATALVFFAYLGFENIASLAEEAHEPERAIPRAVLLSVAITATLYVAVAIAAVALAPPAALAASDSPLVTAVHAESPVAARVLGAVALFATANTGLIALVTVSRVAYGMARDGELPAVMARTLPRRQTPWVAAIVLGGLAAALLPLGGVATIASLSSFGALVAFIAVDVAVIVLRRRRPRARRPFRVPGAIAGVPVLAVVGALASLVLVTQLERAALIGGAVTLAVGLAIGLISQATGARS